MIFRKSFLILYFLFGIFAFGQNQIDYGQYSILELDSIQEYLYLNGSLQELKKVSKIHFDKAKKKGDSLEMALSLYYRLFKENYEQSLLIADSMVYVSPKSNTFKFPAAAYIYKGYRQYQKGLYAEAIESYITGNNLAIQNNNNEQIYSAMSGIAAIKNVNGFHSEALDIYRKLYFDKEKNTGPESSNDDLLLIYNISLAHLRLNSIDSSRVYVNKGIKKALELKDSRYYQKFVLVGAQVDYYDGKILKAKDSIDKYIEYYSENEKAEKLYYLGQVAGKIGDSTKKQYYFKQIDSIISLSNEPIDNTKEVYNYLLLDASKIKNYNKQLYYIERLLYFDSLNSLNQNKVTNLRTIGYDLPMLKREKKMLENKLSDKDLKSKLYLAVAIAIACISFFLLARYYILSRKLNHLIKSKLETIKPINSTSEIEDISSEIINQIIRGLESFEKNKEYLDINLTQEILARKLNSNSTYISKVVNNYKGVNFSTYLKDLRITNAINTINSEPSISQKYTIAGLAELFGFKSPDSFSRALFKKTGVNASSYIKKVINTR